MLLIRKVFTETLIRERTRLFYFSLDQTARAGLRLMRLLSFSSRSFSPWSSRKGTRQEFSKKDLNVLITFLCPLSRVLFDHLSWIALRFTHEGQESVFVDMNFQVSDSRKKFRDLVEPSADLFQVKSTRSCFRKPRNRRNGLRWTWFLRPPLSRNAHPYEGTNNRHSL